MTAMIQIENLTKRFGRILAVDGVSFSVDQGEVLGFLGPNGAGKSTTMKMVTGFLPPTGGRAVVCGHDVGREPTAAREKLGYLPEGAPAYLDMTPEGFLGFVAEVRGFRGKEKKQRVARAVELAELEGVLRQSIETLSKGFKRRVGLAQALLHDPRVLIMDEPTDGLDPNQKHQVRRLIRSMGGSKAIVLSTHILEEVEAVCSRVVIISRGRLVFDGTPEELAARSRHHNAVALTVRSVPAAALKEELGRLGSVGSVGELAEQNGRVSCVAFARDGKSPLPEVSRLAQERSWEVDGLYVQRGRLDDVFRELTGSEHRLEAGATARRQDTGAAARQQDAGAAGEGSR
jgi:ABC-2 type transport system ATP-binding protein